MHPSMIVINPPLKHHIYIPIIPSLLRFLPDICAFHLFLKTRNLNNTSISWYDRGACGASCVLRAVVDQLTQPSDQAAVDAGGDGMAEARSTSSGSCFMLLMLPVPLRCEMRSGLLNPWLRVSSSDREGPAYSASRLLF